MIAPFQDIFTKWARHRERSQRSRVRVECANRIPEIFAIYPVCVRADSLQLGIVEPDVAATWTTIHNDRTEPHQLRLPTTAWALDHGRCPRVSHRHSQNGNPQGRQHPSRPHAPPLVVTGVRGKIADIPSSAIQPARPTAAPQIVRAQLHFSTSPKIRQSIADMNDTSRVHLSAPAELAHAKMSRTIGNNWPELQQITRLVVQF